MLQIRMRFFRSRRFMILCLLLGIQPLQTQKLPSRAANGPGFAVLAEARTLRENEAYEAAFHKAMEAVRISKEAGNLETWGDSFEEAFQCAFHCEDIDLYPPLMEALKDASAQLANLQQVPPKTQAVIWGRMGTVHHASGAYNQAFEWYEKALPYSEQSGDSSLTMRLYANAGTLIWDQGDDFRALNYLEKSLTLATALEDTVMMGRITTSLGNVYRMIEPEKSVAVFQRAIALQPNNSLAHVLLSKAYLETKKDVAKARETALVSLQLAEDEAEKADAFHQLGRVFFEEKNYPKALEYYDRAIQFGLPGYGKNSPEYIKIHVFKGDVYLAQQQFSKADAAYRQTLIELLPLFRPSNPNQLPVLDELTTISPWILDALLGQAKTRKAQYRQTNDPENLKSALSAYELAIAYQNRIKLRFADDLSKFQFNSYYNTTCESALQIAFELYRMFQTPEYAARAFSLSEQTKAVVLAEGLYKRQLKQVVGVPSELLEAERTAEVNIANYEMKLSETDDPSEIGLIKDSLFAARREKEALEYRIKTTFPAYADALYSWQATTKLEDVQNDLPDHAALITYFLGDHSFCTFLIAKDTFWMQEKPLPEEFVTVLADFNHSISDWQYANDSSAVSGNVFLKNSHVLYQWLLQEPLAFTP
ncbi:MAG: tetratricopeptide repeat protein, partial [Saprospiraceae bacterium]|nr:tetratricopeptide repeat protein [Saprospiraceae bacterium]